MAKPSQTHKQVKLLVTEGHPAGSPRIVLGHDDTGPIFGKSGDIVTLPRWEANSLIVANIAEPSTKGVK